MSGDGCVEDAMFLSGYLDRVPPLGALNSTGNEIPRLQVSLVGDDFPFKASGVSEHRPNRELNEIPLNPVCGEAG